MTKHAVSNRADLRERTKTMSRHGDRRGQIADFRDSFETISWLYLLFKCGIKTKAHFEWLIWRWSSLGQLNLEPTRPNGFVGCKVPTDFVKISAKEATHMGFHYNTSRLNQPQSAIMWNKNGLKPTIITFLCTMSSTLTLLTFCFESVILLHSEIPLQQIVAMNTGAHHTYFCVTIFWSCC